MLAAGCGTDSSTVTTSTVTVTRDSAPPTASPTPEATRDFAVGPFTAVRLDAHYDVAVDIGSPASVRAQGDPAALDLLDIRTEGDTLVAGSKPNVQWPADARVTVTVTTPTLTAAGVSGSGDMRIGPVRTDTLRIEQDGSGSIEAADLTLTRLELSSEGSGDVRAAGRADDAVIRTDGSGDAELGQFAVKRAEVSMGGSGELSIEVSESVTGSTSGSGDVEVTGGGACSISASGSGEIACS